MGLLYHLRYSFKLLWCLFLFYFYQVHAQGKVFNLINYGGVASLKVDNSKALISAWKDACKWKGNGEAKILIPPGTYLLNPVHLTGPCKGPVKLANMGRLQSPPGPSKSPYYIDFCYVDGLTIHGGSIDGKGQTAWDHLHQISSTLSLISLSFVNNTIIRGVKLINSQKNHINIFASHNIRITKTKIISPETSPNTDGIKMALSSAISITDSRIESGDDCIAILNGTSNVNVTRVWCGPGHGISIGSMGNNPGDEVKQISVTNCTFSRTLNGVRIKSWAKPNSGVCSGITFKDIIIDHAYNPIIIDQNYCPSRTCPKGNSQVQISGVNFSSIKGTSASKEAINLQCSGSHPCKDVRLENINLAYEGPGGGPAIQLCSNVKGSSKRVQIHGSCTS